MRIQPSDPIFADSDLALIRKYFLENGLRDYRLYLKAGTETAIAPAQVLIREGNRFQSKQIYLLELQLKENRLFVHIKLDGEETTFDGKRFGNLISQGEFMVAVASEDPDLQKSFPLAAGLFNYGGRHDSFVVNFSPHFGHGEHAEYFISWLGTPFGFFSPASFTGIAEIDRHQSREIFGELLNAHILNRAGVLANAEKLRSYSFKTALSPTQTDAARHLILMPRSLPESRAQFDRLIEFTRISEPEKKQILSDIKSADISGPGLNDFQNATASQIPEIFRTYPDADREKLFQFFVSRKVSILAQEQIILPRGILKENRKKEALILLYEPIHVSSNYYGSLLDFFQRVKQGYSLHIALAYSRTISRGRQKLLHPLVEALRDLENLKTIENVSPMEFE